MRYGIASTRLRTLGRALSLFLPLGVLITAGQARAAGPGDYVPYVPAAPGSQHSAALFVVLAYSAIWLVLLLYVASVSRRQRRLEAELTRLREQLDGERGARAPQPSSP